MAGAWRRHTEELNSFVGDVAANRVLRGGVEGYGGFLRAPVHAMDSRVGMNDRNFDDNHGGAVFSVL